MRASLVCVLLSLSLSLCHACPKECACDGDTKVVDCSGRGLYDVPRRLHPDTLELRLQDNRIRGLGSMAFRETPLVRVLDLSNNSITSVSPSALLGLRGLQRLSLANNSLRELDRRLLGPIHSLTHLDLSHNSLWGLPGAMGESLRNLSYLGLAHNRLPRIERSLLEGLGQVDSLTLQGNPWRCDCQLIGLKLWLETYLFKGGAVDEVICVQPEGMTSKDLRKVPYQLFHACMTTSYNYLFANIHHLEATHHRNHAHPAGAGGPPPTLHEGGGGGGGPPPVVGVVEVAAAAAGGSVVVECEPKQRPRPVNLRHAIATVIITGVVCGIVLLLMLAAAVYGCAYAAIMAKYQRELKKKNADSHVSVGTATAGTSTSVEAAEGADHAAASGAATGDKEPLENAIA